MCIIGVYTNEQKDCGFETTKKAVSILKNKGVEFYLDEQVAGQLDPTLAIGDRDVNYLLVFGGDGTMLSAARKYAPRGTAILGFNMGRMGFLLDTEISELENAIDGLLTGNFKIEERLMLEVEVTAADGHVREREFALNESVISQRAILRIINIDVRVNGQMMDSLDCDGVIVATPTGSTGYNLSAGGSVVTPGLDVMLITPVCNHSLSSGRMIISGDDVVTIEPSANSRFYPALTLDGQRYIDINAGDKVIVKRAGFKARFIRYTDKNFFMVLKDKFTEWSRK